MPEIGDVLGMTVRNNTDQRIADLYKMDEMSRRTDAINEARVKMLANDLDFQNAANSYDNGRIKEYSMGIVKKLGQYARENPDMKYNPDKLVQFNLMRRELKDNPELNRGVASDSAFAQLNKDLQEVAKNPQQHDSEAYQAILSMSHTSVTVESEVKKFELATPDPDGASVYLDDVRTISFVQSIGLVLEAQDVVAYGWAEGVLNG